MTRVRIASWNINGVRARLPVLLAWLEERGPDVALLQEIKIPDEGFPREEVERLGYRVETHGQKSFNGVAILSRLALEDVVRGLPDAEGAGPDGEDDAQARWLEATAMGGKGAVRLCCLYLPNGNPAPGPKYAYKLRWFDRLRARAADLLATEEPVVLGGDWNVIPEPRDARRPEAWAGDALFLPESRAAFRRVEAMGFYDAIRLRRPFDAAGPFTFWDYQRGAWERDDGIRIDHHLLSPQAADLLRDAWVEREARAGEKPSDHVPVWAELDA
nr:exodeoxyribonuclease III [Rubellimicrobium sp. CFH 75288]